MEIIYSMYLNLLQALKQVGIRDIIDIAIISICIYKLLRAIRETRAIQVFKGVSFILVAAIIANFFELSAVSWLLNALLQSGVILILILFQPELRRTLEGIGRGSMFRGGVHSDGGERLMTDICDAVLELAKRKIGALIVIQQKSSLTDIISTGTVINSDISVPLILNIFEPNTPLHDGAVVISGDRITAAGCFLPLSENMSISKELGTRHRAGLGISENSDCVTFIVSEETGVISCATEGKLIRYLDKKTIMNTLIGIYGTGEEKKKIASFGFGRRKKNEDEED